MMIKYIVHIFTPKGDNFFIGHELVMNHGTTCFGLHTFLIVTDLAGVTTVGCSIDLCFCIRCNFLF
jgi:hypothetical protein